jgi:hypothetical protein
MSFPDTGLSVSLQVEDGAVAAIQIRSGRLVQASRMLAGRSPAQVSAILPSIYALCGTAQALAGATAMEQALGLSPSPALRMARRFLVMVETLTEHAQSILRDWPDLLGERVDLDAVKPLRPMVATARRILFPDGDWAKVGGGRLAPDCAALAEQTHLLADMVTRLFVGTRDEWEEDPQLFHAWASRRECVAARLLHRITESGLSGFGNVQSAHFMPATGPRDLEARLAADHNGDYVARPDCAHIPLETSPLSRQRGHPLVAALMTNHGCGLMPLLAARLVNVAAALREVEELVQDLCDACPPATPCQNSGPGMSMIDAARGLLVHRVELEEGLVRRYQILAPTEWNFHPQGAFSQGLMGAKAGPDLAWRARLLAAALDPCVSCQIEVMDHA